MAFIWDEHINPGDSIDNEDLNEIKDNLDIIYNNLGIN